MDKKQSNSYLEIDGFVSRAFCEYKHCLLEALEQFKIIDPDLAKHIIELFGNDERAAFFMGQENKSIGGTPYFAISKGKRDEVLSLLDGIEYWIKP